MASKTSITRLNSNESLHPTLQSSASEIERRGSLNETSSTSMGRLIYSRNSFSSSLAEEEEDKRKEEADTTTHRNRNSDADKSEKKKKKKKSEDEVTKVPEICKICGKLIEEPETKLIPSCMAWCCFATLFTFGLWWLSWIPLIVGSEDSSLCSKCHKEVSVCPHCFRRVDRVGMDDDGKK